MATPQPNIWDALGGIAQNVGAFYMDKQQNKAAQKLANTQLAIARAQAKLPMIGMGYAATPLGAGSMPTGAFSGGQTMFPQVVPASFPANLGITPDSFVGGMLGLRAPGGPTYTLETTASGRQVVRGMRSLGTPLLWSGDLSAVRRVGRVARKLGRFGRRRPR